MKRRIVILMVFGGIVCPGCKRAGIVGSGVAATELRDVGDFDEVEFLGTGRLELATGALKPLEITADDNILPILRSSVHGRRLTIRPVESIRPHVDILIRATVPALKLVSSSGNPEVAVTDIDNEAFSIQIRGNGKVVAHGTTGELAISIVGNGDVETFDLSAQTVNVSITGHGSVQAQAHKTLTVSITGAGAVRYHGNPEVHQTIIGSGTVTRQ